MDVHCTTCGEPWDTFHLWQDAIYETGLTEKEADAWRKLPTAQKLSDCYRKHFRAAGYEWGNSIINVIRCPGCPEDAKPDPDLAAMKAGIVEIMGEDEDGIAATMEDFGL